MNNKVLGVSGNVPSNRLLYRRARFGFLAVALGAAAGIHAAEDGGAGMAQGRADYLTYCASCHGANGEGDGPVSGSLKNRPPEPYLPETTGNEWRVPVEARDGYHPGQFRLRPELPNARTSGHARLGQGAHQRQRQPGESGPSADPASRQVPRIHSAIIDDRPVETGPDPLQRRSGRTAIRISGLGAVPNGGTYKWRHLQRAAASTLRYRPLISPGTETDPPATNTGDHCARHWPAPGEGLGHLEDKAIPSRSSLAVA